MKKVFAIIIIFTLVLPYGVFAAEGGEVEPAENNSSGNTALFPSQIAPPEVEAATAENKAEAPADNPSAKTGEDGEMSTLTEDPPPIYEGDKKLLEEKKPNDPDSSSGSFIFNFPIEVPPGRNGMQPDLKLTYDSGSSDNQSPFGYGWSINIPYIERINREGAESLYTDNYFYSSLDGELVASSTEEQGMFMMQSPEEKITAGVPAGESLLEGAPAASLESAESPESPAIVPNAELSKEALIEKGLAFTKDDGSVELYEPIEDEDLRTAASKAYLKGFTADNKKVYQGQFYGGQINYLNSSGQYEEINTNLVDSGDSWKMSKASYGLTINKILGSNFLAFSNKGQELYFSLVGNETASSSSENEITGILQTEGSWGGKQIQYKDAISPGVDLRISANNEALVKEAVINSLESLGDLEGKEYYEIPFLLTSNRKIDIKIGDRLLSQEGVIESSEMVEVIDEQGGVSYIWAPLAKDSSGMPDGTVNISIEYQLRDDGIYLVKKIPVSFLKQATYPVTTDAVVSYFSGNGDGWVESENSNWSTAHDADTGHSAGYTGGDNWAEAGQYSSLYYIYRAFMPVNTSAIGTASTITAASWFIKIQSTYDTPTSIHCVSSSQANNDSLSTADFDAVGNTSFSEASTSIMSGNAYHEWALNAGGIANISGNSWSKFAFREDQDLDNTTPASPSDAGIKIYSSEAYGTSSAPYLQVTYIPSSNPVAPSSLQAEGQSNPTGIEDQMPEFSAIYNDSTGDLAYYYQVQVANATSSWASPVWDSGKTALASTTPVGARSEDNSYGGNKLQLDGRKYYWRMKFWDQDDNPGDWSDGSDNFTMATTSPFKAKIETGNFNKYEYLKGGSFWMTDKKGNVYKFGLSEGSRQDDPNDASKVFKVMLEEVRDTNDNYIKYEYYKNAGQIYPSKITYTGSGTTDGIFEVEFLRESRSDNLSSYKTGFEAASNYRIYEIRTKVNGEWVKKYELDYTTGNNNNRSLVNTITESGQDEQSNTITLPANDFDYQSFRDGFTENGGLSITNPNSPFNHGPIPMGDFNGDGLIDIFNIDDTYINDGGANGWTLDSNYTFETGGINNHSHAVDVNGDGYSDFLTFENGVTDTYINDGDGTGWTFDTDYLMSLWSTGGTLYSVPIGDFNGDGLPDLYNCQVSECRVLLNDGDGTGWTEDAGYNHPTGVSNDSSAIDLNADGFDDLIYESGGYNYAYLNKGDGTGWATSTIGISGSLAVYGDYNSDGLVDYISEDPVYHTRALYINDGDLTWTIDSTNYTIPTGTLYPAEVDGDGLTDIIENEGTTDGASHLIAKINTGLKSDLISRVEISEGGTTDVKYKGSGEYLDGSNNLLNPDLPYGFQTVNQLITNDGLGNIATSTYSYAGGDFYFGDEYDRRSAGFNKIEKTDPLGNITKTWFHQGNGTASTTGEYLDDQSKIGKPYRTEVYDGSGNLYAKAISKWENVDKGDSSGYVKITRKTDFSYDGDSDHKEKAESYAYDDTYGNLTEKISYGEVTGSDDGSFTDTGTDLASSTIEYIASTTPYIVGLPKHESVYDQSANKVKESKYYYDTLAYGNVGKGNLTKEEMWKSGASYVDIEKTYNSYGLITQEKDPRDKATDYTYDGYNLNVATSTNPLSQTTEYYYDYSSGQPKKVVDANSREFQTVYDALDRPIEEKQPDISNPSTLVTKTTYEYNDGITPRMIKRTDYLTGSSSGGSGGGTAIFNAVPGDGQVSAGFQTMDWNQVHNSTYGTALDYTGTFSRAESNKSRVGNDEYRIYRGFMAFDTSSLPEDAVITSASLKLYVFDKDSADNDGNDFISAVSADQESTAYLEADDYDLCGATHNPTELSSRIDISSGIALNQYNSLAFNATGTGLINKSGWTKLGVREGHDIIDEAYAGPILSGNYILWNSADNASTSTRPYLEVSYNYPDFAGNVSSYAYLDGFNRKTQERNKAEAGNTYSVKDYTYNKLGLLDKESLPYFSLNASSTPMTATSSLFINYTYDSLQRVTQVVNSVATTTNAYDDWKVTITDGEGKAKDLYKDAYDNLIQVDEHNATSTYSTYYQYNLLGNLTKITDALGNVRNFTYDALGRRLTAQDLHASGDGTYGTWTYTFDDSGNLTSKLDPKSQTINYTYDDLNRVLTENYTGSAGTEVSYGYDTCLNGKGRMCSATTTASILNLAYNALGLVSSERKTINSTDYTTTYSYDRQGNQTLITIPDSTEIKYEYNNAGLLEKVSKKQTDDSIYYYLLEDIDYNPLGQKTYENYANNTASYYIYDEDKLYRLEEKQTSIATSSLQDLSYTYDKVGNITKIIDSSNTNTAKTMDFTYDDLHRLTVASSTNAVSGDNFRETYSYNAIGNITNKSDVGNYLYQGTNYANPHAATNINGATYTYDNNGNLTSDSTWTHSWDCDNRLTQSSSGTATTTYAYDQDGNRVKKTEAGETSYYINPYYEVDNGMKKRHILANGTAIATIEDEINTLGCMPPESGDWTISASCQLMTSARAQGDVTVNAGAVLTIASSTILEIDLHNRKLLVRHNGGVKIKKGSTLRQTTQQTLPVTLRSNTIYHYPDHLMGTSIDTNDQGVILEAIDYLPFGETRIDEKAGTHENGYKFTGKELDSSTDLYYFGARYYNADVGKFNSIDPAFLEIGSEKFNQEVRNSVFDSGNDIFNNEKENSDNNDQKEKLGSYLSNPQALNSYSYGLNNPLKFKDEKGKAVALAVPLIIGATVGLIGGAVQTYHGDVVKNVNSGKTGISKFAPDLSKSGVKEYGANCLSGAATGAVAAINPLLGGLAETVSSALSNKFTTGKFDLKSAAINGLVTTATAGVVGKFPKVPGRLPKLLSRSFFTGAHTQRAVVEEATHTGVRAILNSLTSLVSNLIRN